MVRTTRTLITLLTAVVLTTASLVLATTPASAAPSAPTGLSTDAAVPVLAWDAVPGSTGYDVEVSARADFTTRAWTKSTVNTRVVPDVALPAGRLFWRVRAKESSSVSDWASSDVRLGAVEAPSTLPVTDGGDPVRQPDDPALLRWTAVPGAASYEVQVGTDPEFTDPAQYDAHETATLAWLVSDSASQLPGNTYHWRVRADLGNAVTSPWSTNGTYAVQGLDAPDRDPALEEPGADVMQDVVLDWEPVSGAARYDVRISADENFSSGVTTVRTVATRWSPPQTVKNDQYFWQARPVDALGTETPWTDVRTWEFQRNWPDQPALQHPADGAVVEDPLFVQWAPVRLASRYRVDFSTRPDFPDSNITRSCWTRSTTLTVDASSTRTECLLPAPGTERYYWRVRGIDGAADVETDVISAEKRSFLYRPERAVATAPTDGATVSVPTMRWRTAAGAETYQVSWANVSSGSAQTRTTTSTSYTPLTRLAAGTYRWDVRAVRPDGRVSTGLAPEAQPRFTVSADTDQAGGSPDPLTAVLAPTDRFPTLQWQPVAEADHYRLRLRAEGDATYALQSESFAYPAGELSGADHLVTGRWFWQVEAWKGSTFLSAGREGQFSIAPLAPVTVMRASPTGTGAASARSSCDMGLLEPGAQSVCQDLDQTPVVRWEPVPGASAYRIEVTSDRERTTELAAPLKGEFWVHAPMWAYDEQLPDQQAGSAYFVSVRACKTADVLTCEAEEHAEHAVNKLGSPVELTGPARDAEVQDDVTFTWRDHLATNQDPTLDRDATGQPATAEARGYEIEVSTDASFTDTSKRVVRTVVDQTTFTAPGVTLPEGVVHWRVRAVDGTGNPLPWSPSGRITKRSPRPVPLVPGAREAVAGGEPFRWAALPFAATYDVEVTRNGVLLSTAGGTTKQTALAADQPLPAGGGYSWRVRRGDASGRKGEWSDPVPFTVRGATPQQVLPEESEELAPAGALFSWEVVSTASRYRFQRRAVGTTALVENVTTSARAHAPLVRIPAGQHEWRVVALDADGAELGASTWRGFTVQSGPTAPAPPVTGPTRVGGTLTAAEPDWSMPDVTTTVQWYRGSTAITGATSSDYVTTSADANQTVRARFTGTRPGWAPGVVDSITVRVTSGVAPQLVSALEVEGPGRVGTELTVGPVSWDAPDVTTTYQWLRNDGLLRGSTGATYLLTADDVGDRITVRVTGKRTGYDDGIALSEAVVVSGASAPVATTPPGVSGTPRVGQILTATPGTWSVEGLTYAYQWLRDGEPISSGGTRSEYRLVTADAGRKVSVRVTAKKTGYTDGTATSPTRAVAKLPSSTTARPSVTRVKVGRAVTVAVEVSAAGATPTGAVTLLVDGVKVTTAALDSDGEASLRYVPRSAGKDKLVVAYAGRAPVAASQSPATTVTVVR